MKTQKFKKFLMSVNFILLLSISGVFAANNMVVDTWPGKTESVKIIKMLINDAIKENQSVSRADGSLQVAKIKYLSTLADQIKLVKNGHTVDEAFERNHNRYMTHGSIDGGVKTYYEQLRVEIIARVDSMN